MIINHNMQAINAHRQMGANATNAQKSMEKLSSGLRINRAGDDAAGLAISEKMRGQIRGLDQAGRNAQDGISLIQTAEGALNETHSILQRMRELSVQSGNDTNTADDRAELQKEVEQLKSEIDRISETTEFNTKKLLNGDLGSKSKVLTNPNSGGVLNTGDMKAGDYSVKITAEAKQATAASGTADATGDLSAKTLTINGVNIDLTDLNAATAADVITRINSYSEKTGVTVAAGTGDKIVAKSNTYGTEGNIVVGGDSALLGAVTAGVDAAVEVTNGAGNKQTITGKGQEVVYEGGTLSAKGAANATFTFNVERNDAKLQIGANQDQNIAINIGEISSSTLGKGGANSIANLDITSQTGANSAIEVIDEALKQVSAQRSNLGAVQNRLEHTINNLGTSSENLTAAESRIRDVDMAKEMMTMSKNNILNQAAQAMLAQANQGPQQVL